MPVLLVPVQKMTVVPKVPVPVRKVPAPVVQKVPVPVQDCQLNGRHC